MFLMLVANVVVIRLYLVRIRPAISLTNVVISVRTDCIKPEARVGCGQDHRQAVLPRGSMGVTFIPEGSPEQEAAIVLAVHPWGGEDELRRAKPSDSMSFPLFQ